MGGALSPVLRAVGFNDDDFQKPQVGIASTWSMVTPCNSHIGELAFWSHAGKQADRLAAALAEPGAEPEKVLRRELGVTFGQLTVGLLKTWNMGEIGQLVQASRTSDGPAARAVALGSDLAGRVAAAGWTDASVQALIEPVAELIGTDAEHAWQNARHEQLADILFGHDTVENENDARRDQNAEGPARGNGTGRKAVGITVLAHGRHRDLRHGRGRGKA